MIVNSQHLNRLKTEKKKSYQADNSSVLLCKTDILPEKHNI